MTKNRRLILVWEYYGTIKNKPLGENLGDLEFGNEFLHIIPKAQLMKEKIGEFNFINTKNFCCVKDNVKRMRRHDIEWETVFVKHVCGKGLVSKLYKELLKLYNKRTSNPIKS